MPNNNFVPDVPSDWAAKAALGIPYLLGVVAGAAAWVPLVAGEPVTLAPDVFVTANNGRAVFTLTA